MAVREGDFLTTGHGCTSITTLAISLIRTVLANRIVGAVRGTPVSPHTIPNNDDPPKCVSHSAVLNQGSPNVLIGGIPWGRVGDSADNGAMISGSLNVLVNGR
jgi:uncharacterized Zn-binding protein involved in type VI secretion